MQTTLDKTFMRDTAFANLMTRRIYQVLLVANPYDAFMLEDDGRIDEKLFIEYTSLSLRYPPRFTRVCTDEEAWQQLQSRQYDLVICMPSTDDSDFFATGRAIKEAYPKTPVVILTPFSHGITRRLKNEDLSAFEMIFCWLGNTDLLLSIIKLMEDRMNLSHDIDEVGVQMILLVEDSIRFYSSVLPYLYKFVLQQSREFATEALNEHQKTLRMRGRPKIVLARNYEEAMEYYDRYHDNVLGVITDVSYSREGEVDSKAGLRLCAELRMRDPYLPFIIESTDVQNRTEAEAYGTYIDKSSRKIGLDLQRALKADFFFGDFIFRNPQTGEEIARACNLKELQDQLYTIPHESMMYHVSHNHISRWLYSRAMFPPADFLKHVTWNKIDDVDQHRKLIFSAIVKYRKMKNQGVVAEFHRDRFDRYSNFARIGEGSLGGKGRGLAFMDNLVKHHQELNSFENARVEIPKTVVLCTDIFDEFMEINNLYPVALSNTPDEMILQHFLQAEFPKRFEEDFLSLFEVMQSPIAIRSSSLLEDSHYQPFAGVYSTYMIPLMADRKKMLHHLTDAIKGVYASVYYRDSKAYMVATQNVIDQEKMAVVLQQVVGNQYGDRYYPSFSGVARSLNYYPIGEEKPEEGTVSLALGLGKYIVDGGLTLRFCPSHPNQVLQTSEMELCLSETQTRFYALDLGGTEKEFSIDDGFNLLKLSVAEAEKDGALQFIASTFNPQDQCIYDGLYPGGRKLITFANILHDEAFPLSCILQQAMRHGENGMRRPVEIEFAVTLNDAAHLAEDGCIGTFYLLQIRPIVDNKSTLDEDLLSVSDEDTVLRSNSALGHGVINTVTDLIYVKTGAEYTASANYYVADEIEQLNRKFLEEGRNYILVGPGRWGSNDHWLGVPVKWPHISAAQLIVEAGLTNYRVDPSQGTHFFQNLTSFGVGYFTINSFLGDGIYDQAYLDNLPAITETKYIRHVRAEKPFIIKIDGKKNIGVVLKPNAKELPNNENLIQNKQ
ncbi:MAG: phosphoenolpyruvate synthase [Bacteroidaceae bacterium]|nr:phosphoenolpyruvate synthase [Bacteroidaceae bacterium]